MPYKREGSKYWQIRVGGVPRSSGTTDFEAAKALEDKLNHELWMEQHMGKKPAHSWQEAVVRYLNEKSNLRNLDRVKKKLLWWDQHLGAVEDISKISRGMIDEIMQKNRVVDPAKPIRQNGYANEFVIRVSAILRMASDEWEWIDRCPRLRLYPYVPAAQSAYTLEQWRQLCGALAPHKRRLATFALATGMREGMVVSLQWQSINLEKRYLQHEGSTTKRANIVPLNDTAMSVLEECRQEKVVHSKWVFLWAGTPLKRVCPGKWKEHHRKAGVPYIKFHGLRTTFTSWLAMNGAPKEIRKRLLGHTTVDVHDSYTIYELDGLRPYVAIIDKVLAGTTNSSQSHSSGQWVACNALKPQKKLL